MTGLTRTALCPVRTCPWPDDPDAHRCAICGKGEIQHHHLRDRGMGGTKFPSGQVCLCPAHHELITLNRWRSDERQLPDERLVGFIQDEHGNVLWERISPSSSGGEGGSLAVGVLADSEYPSPPEPGEEIEPPTRTGEDPLGRTPNVVDVSSPQGAGGDSREAGLSRAATVPGPRISTALKPNGLELPAEFTFDEWLDLAGMVMEMNHNRQWWAGDLVLAGERFGERATQYWNDLGYQYESLANCVRVCRRFPRPLRNEVLQFSHHAVVLTLDDIEARQWLNRAARERWTVRQLREAVFGVKPKKPRCWTEEQLRDALDEFHDSTDELPHSRNEQAGNLVECATCTSIQGYIDWLAEHNG